MFETSRGSVRQAMARLRTAGKISSGRGRRSIVLGTFNPESFEAAYSITARQGARHVTQKINWLARRPASEKVAAVLNIEPGDPIVYVNRLRTIDESVRVIQEHYFPYEVGRHILDFEESDSSLHDTLTAAGVCIDNVERTLQMTFATEEEASLLGVEPNFPLFHSIQKLHDHNGEPVEYSEYKYRGDRIELSITTVRGTAAPLRIRTISPESD